MKSLHPGSMLIYLATLACKCFSDEESGYQSYAEKAGHSRV